LEKRVGKVGNVRAGIITTLEKLKNTADHG